MLENIGKKNNRPTTQILVIAMAQHRPSHETGAPSLPTCGRHRFEHR
jgi:hypothetical protein